MAFNYPDRFVRCCRACHALHSYAASAFDQRKFKSCERFATAALAFADVGCAEPDNNVILHAVTICTAITGDALHALQRRSPPKQRWRV